MTRPGPNSSESARLLDAISAGDRSAFDKLFARHRRYLRGVIELRLDPRLRSRVDPSDVIQETHLEAFRRLEDYLKRRPMAFRLWLRKTAQERLLMAHRQHIGSARRSVAREHTLPDRSSFLLAQRLIAPSSSPQKRFDLKERARAVRAAMTQLSEGDREILLMRNLEGLSNQEVAQVLQVDPPTASQRYGRALLRLRQCLADRGLLED
jgi:RNA polymerase sigma-70 factor (ECF subfamily)